MAQLNTHPTTQGPVIPVKPQPNVYTAMILLSAVVLAVAFGVVAYDLIVNYGLSFGQVFTGVAGSSGT